MKNNFLSRIAAVFIASVFSISFVFAAGGVGGEPLNSLDSENPGWFVYHLGPGESYDDVLIVKNNSDQEWIVDIYPADSIYSSGGGFALKQRVEEMATIGKWVDLSVNEVQLQAGEVARVPFTITVPENADIGETAGAIMFEKRDPKVTEIESKEEGGIKLSIRTGVRVYNTVPGEIEEEVKLRDFSAVVKKKEGRKNYFFIQSQVENTGNISTKAIYVITITDLSGKEIKKIESEFLVSRDTTFENNQEIEDIPNFGKFNVKLDVYTELKNGVREFVETRELSVIIIPLREILGGLILLIIIIILAIRHHRKHSGKGWVNYTVEEGENIIDLAARHNVAWKALAKTNKLKSPYLLTGGMQILVPPKKNL